MEEEQSGINPLQYHIVIPAWCAEDNGRLIYSFNDNEKHYMCTKRNKGSRIISNMLFMFWKKIIQRIICKENKEK